MLDPRIVRLAVFVIVMMTAGALLGFSVYSHFGGTDAANAGAVRRSLAQIEEQLNGIEKRLGVLENRRKSELAKAPPSDVKGPQPDVPSHGGAPRVPQAQIQVSPAFRQSRTVVVQPPLPDPVSAQRLATLEQGIGALQDETGSNREVLQATTNRLAEVAGELGAQHGQIIKNQDELSRFLGRTEHTAVTFELRRGLDPEPVGPVRISLKTSNQKSQRYTLCVYLQDACIQVKDRVVFEVVQLAVSRDTGPLELIATKVDKDGIVGYLEVPRENPGH